MDILLNPLAQGGRRDPHTAFKTRGWLGCRNGHLGRSFRDGAVVGICSPPCGKSEHTGLAALLGTALLLTACADAEENADDDGENPGGQSLVPEAEGNVDYPLSIDTIHGEIELEERPERIAVMGHRW
ncbi:hypothetical protein HGQ17_03640 [Nesterenkonia sp. MY13]|uniref:Uncharacterized protein n=1 Tax=Nesterenkonia sedimenti TaxID=1463632 RepID=A0A7X8TI10_9MICC|nr:hypothetical protein [Nesterenkonia sedimenti]NLS09110.1 hypothetical protein [Nesterenkonia sedimenti]